MRRGCVILIISLSVIAFVVSILFFSMWGGNPLNLPLGVMMMIYFPVCIGCFLWWTIAIRCPRCYASPTWYHLTNGAAANAVSRRAPVPA